MKQVIVENLSVALTSQELKTLESYRKIALARNKTHASPDFWRPEFEKFRSLLPHGKIADIGCGGGRDAVLFTEAGYDYVGVDISEEMLSAARELVPTANFIRGSVYELNFPSKSLDGFWAAASVLHIPKNKATLALQEIRRVTRLGGIGFFSMKEGEGERMVGNSSGGDERLFSFYSENEFTKILEENGFRVLEHSRDMREYRPPGNTTVWLLFFVEAA